jgi:ligand-binding sensor domain-containing protein
VLSYLLIRLALFRIFVKTTVYRCPMYLRKFICQVGLIKLGEKKKIKGHQFGRGTIKKKKASHELSNAHMVADNFRWASIGNN